MNTLKQLQQEWRESADKSAAEQGPSYVTPISRAIAMQRWCASELEPFIAQEAASLARYQELVRAAKLAEAVLVRHITADTKVYRKYRDAWEPLVAALAAIEKERP